MGIQLMLMMLALRFAKSVQSFRRIGPCCGFEHPEVGKGIQEEIQLMLMMLTVRFAMSVQAFRQIGSPAVDSNTRRSERQS